VNRTENILTRIDKITVLLFLVMVVMGWLNIYAAVYSDNHQDIFDFSQSYGKQIIWIGAAFFIAIILMLIEQRNSLKIP